MLNIIKIGSGCLFDKKGELSTSLIQQRASEIESSKEGHILVVSGAIALGKMGGNDHRSNDEIPNVELQGYASVGQIKLMEIYQRIFKKDVAQILLTSTNLEKDAMQGKSIADLLRTNLSKGWISAINYNDSVDFEQLRKDNDTLAAAILAYANADRLVVLGRGYEGLYDKRGKVVPKVDLITPSIEMLCNGKSQTGNGGFETKLEAAKMVMAAQKEMIVGSVAYPLQEVVAGRVPRTLFRGHY